MAGFYLASGGSVDTKYAPTCNNQTIRAKPKPSPDLSNYPTDPPGPTSCSCNVRGSDLSLDYMQHDIFVMP